MEYLNANFIFQCIAGQDQSERASHWNEKESSSNILYYSSTVFININDCTSSVVTSIRGCRSELMVKEGPPLS